LHHTSQHFEDQAIGWPDRVADFGEFLVGQVAVVSPITCGLFAVIGMACFGLYWRLGPRERFLFCFSGLPLGGVLALSLIRHIEPNWPAAFYPAGIILVSAAGLNRVQAFSWTWLTERKLRMAAAVGAVLAGLIYLLPFGFGLAGSKFDPLVRMRGWRELGLAVGREFQQLPHCEKTFVMVAAGRSVASELAFYIPSQPEVYLWDHDGQIDSQYDLWGDPRGKQNWHAMIVTDADQAIPAELAVRFGSINLIENVQVSIGHGRAHRVRLWHAAQYIDNALSDRIPRLSNGQTTSLITGDMQR
jgi:undecaprenyl-diphosphatase